MTPRPVIALTTIAGVAVYLGLAILGWGGFTAFFANPARTAAAVATLALTVVALFTAANLSKGEREDRANRWVIPALVVLGLLGAWLPAYTDRLDIGTFGGDTVRWIGVIGLIIGGALRLWPVFVLGRRFSGLVAIQPGHALVTTGLYATIRHPSYLGLLLGSLGWALVFRSMAGVLLAALTVIPIVARIGAEERLLQAHFGDAYDSYRGRTSRLIPGIY